MSEEGIETSTPNELTANGGNDRERENFTQNSQQNADVDPVESALAKHREALEGQEPLGKFGSWDFDNLRRGDRRMLGALMGGVKMIDLPDGFAKLGAQALWRDFLKAKDPRTRTMIHRSLMQAARHNLEAATLVAKIGGFLETQHEPSAPPINVAGNATIAVQAPTPQNVEPTINERRRQLMRPADALKEIASDPELVQIAQELAERRFREGEAQAERA